MRQLSAATRQRRLDRMLALCNARLWRLPREIREHPALWFSPQLEGYRRYVFGARAGPQLSPLHLFHELAHAAQFGAAAFEVRATAAGFRFNQRTVCVLGQQYREALTDKATRRELETFGLQLHLMRAAGYRIGARQFASQVCGALRFMEDWHNVPGIWDTQRIEYCVEQVLEFHAQQTQAQALTQLLGWLDATHRRALEGATSPATAGLHWPVFRPSASGALMVDGVIC